MPYERHFLICRRYSVAVTVGIAVTDGIILGLTVTIGDVVGFTVVVGFAVAVVLFVVVTVAVGCVLFLFEQPANIAIITTITSSTKISFFTFSPSFCFIFCTSGQKYFIYYFHLLLYIKMLRIIRSISKPIAFMACR
jgi:hypothetical protein